MKSFAPILTEKPLSNEIESKKNSFMLEPIFTQVSGKKVGIDLEEKDRELLQIYSSTGGAILKKGKLRKLKAKGKK